jgi:flagellar hook-basal body complex protein FliE
MAVLGIDDVSSVGAVKFAAPTLSTTKTGDGFGEMLAKGIQNAEGLQADASSKASLLATGQLTDIHDYTTAAAKASLGVQLTVALRNKAIESYQEIMRMQL